MNIFPSLWHALPRDQVLHNVSTPLTYGTPLIEVLSALLQTFVHTQWGSEDR